MANCGNCLVNDVEIVKLDEKGTCPRCGTAYGERFASSNAATKDDTIHKVPANGETARRILNGDSSAGARQGK